MLRIAIDDPKHAFRDVVPAMMTPKQYKAHYVPYKPPYARWGSTYLKGRYLLPEGAHVLDQSGPTHRQWNADIIVTNPDTLADMGLGVNYGRGHVLNTRLSIYGKTRSEVATNAHKAHVADALLAGRPVYIGWEKHYPNLAEYFGAEKGVVTPCQA